MIEPEEPYFDLISHMIDYQNQHPDRIQHFLKVYEFARFIATGDELSPEMMQIICVAAITHDIGIKPSMEKYGDCTGEHQEQEGPAAERRTQKEDIFMETPAITVHTRLTRTSYRKYMYFHVFRKDSAWLKFTAMCLLVLLFGLINFRTGSPGLGWVFVLLAAYLLVSRYLRFFLSLNRICSQYCLDSLPRTFYSITLSPSGLDVSNNTSLTRLHCNENNLTSLDVTNNTSLTELFCSGNNLSSLDVTNNTSLTELFCSNNNLSSLDVTNNTSLTGLVCYNNNLTSLDVTNNTSLTTLFCYLQNISIPIYKNENEYYIDLSELPLDLKRVSIDETWMTEDGTTYNNTSGRISLSKTKDVGDTVHYLYETNGPASLDNTKMTVTLEISEVRDITEPTTEEPTTEQPTTEQPTTEQPSTAQPPTVEPAPTQTDNTKDAAPKTGDTAPLYPVIFLLIASLAGGVALYVRRRHKL